MENVLNSVATTSSFSFKGDDDDDDDDYDQDNCWSDFETNEDVTDEKPEPLDTFFVKNVAPGGAAESAGLCEGEPWSSQNLFV